MANTTFEIMPLSASTHGKPVLVAATASPGDTVHTAVADASLLDRIWLQAYNDSGGDVDLRIEWGGVTATERIRMTIPYQQGLYAVVNGLLLRNTLIVKAWAGTTNVIALHGWVLRATA